MKQEFEIIESIYLTIVLEGTYQPARADYFDMGFGNWLPGEQEGVEDLSVYIVTEDPKTKEQIRTDVTLAVSDRQYELLQRTFCDLARETNK